MERIRKKYICKYQIKKGIGGMKKLIHLKKFNFSSALMIDQRVSQGIKSDFFSQKALTTTIPAQLGLKYNCKLVPISLVRKENVKFELTIHEPYKIEKTGNDKKDTKDITIKINKILEEMIIKNPKQWIWSHNRWK